MTARHSTTNTWTFPPADRPSLAAGLERTNLKELAARPERFEHHLIVVAKLGCAQLEIATASEPLYFAHVNISDEYAVALPTGDPLLDAFPMRTFVSDAITGADVGRYNHKSGDLVLHPHGFAHWPGKLRPPFKGLDIPPGMRRCGVSLVYCASVPTPSTAPVVALPPGRKPDDVKSYVEGGGAPTLSLAALLHGKPGLVGKIGNTELALVEKPTAIAPPRGGWVVVIVAGGPPAVGGVAGGPPAVGGVAGGPGGSGSSLHAAGDLIRVPRGAVLAGNGIERALVLSGDAEPEPVPPSWTELPAPPFARFEDGAPGALPFEHGSLRVDESAVDPAMVTVSVTTAPSGPGALDGTVVQVPRYWLARMLYRVALHDFRLNHVETYQGLFVDDAGSEVVIGIHESDRRWSVAIPRGDAAAIFERLYRAVAPPGYTERLA